MLQLIAYLATPIVFLCAVYRFAPNYFPLDDEFFFGTIPLLVIAWPVVAVILLLVTSTNFLQRKFQDRAKALHDPELKEAELEVERLLSVKQEAERRQV